MRKRGEDQARYHKWHFEINSKEKPVYAHLQSVSHYSESLNGKVFKQCDLTIIFDLKRKIQSANFLHISLV